MSGSDVQTDALLLRLARSAITSILTGDEFPDSQDESLALMPPSGVFVTLRTQGILRGCIGTFASQEDLPTTLRHMAIAATRDPRFKDTPMSVHELTNLRIELSVLSPLEKIANPLDFDLGRHGIFLRHGFATGCFLPDVGADQGWDKVTFLSMLCSHKAGLSPLAWKEPGVEFSRFTVRKIVEG